MQFDNCLLYNTSSLSASLGEPSASWPHKSCPLATNVQTCTLSHHRSLPIKSSSASLALRCGGAHQAVSIWTSNDNSRLDLSQSVLSWSVARSSFINSQLSNVHRGLALFTCALSVTKNSSAILSDLYIIKYIFHMFTPHVGTGIGQTGTTRTSGLPGWLKLRALFQSHLRSNSTTNQPKSS